MTVRVHGSAVLGDLRCLVPLDVEVGTSLVLSKIVLEPAGPEIQAVCTWDRRYTCKTVP